MVITWVYAITSVVIVSGLSLIGVITLSLRQATLKKMLFLLVSFAIGGLFGDAFIHIIPEAFEQTDSNLATSLSIVSGILIFFVIERFLRWRHCHASASEEQPHPVIALNLIGDAAHNLIDGIIIGASYMVSVPIGITTTLAVVLHEIPQEIGDFAVLIHGGLPVKKALMFNFLSAATAILGAVISLLIGSHIKDYTLIILPMTAGGFIYIAGSCLIPEIQHRCDIKVSASLLQLLMVVLGIGIMALLTFLR